MQYARVGGVLMNIYEKLQDEACKDGIDVVDYPFESKNIKGLYCDGVVAIRENIDTTAEKACVLAEELGHHYTSAGNILDQNQTENIKQERKARMWAYNKQIGLSFTFHNVSINSRPPTTIISSIGFLLFLSTSFYSPHLISIFLL